MADNSCKSLSESLFIKLKKRPNNFDDKPRVREHSLIDLHIFSILHIPPQILTLANVSFFLSRTQTANLSLIDKPDSPGNIQWVGEGLRDGAGAAPTNKFSSNIQVILDASLGLVVVGSVKVSRRRHLFNTEDRQFGQENRFQQLEEKESKP